MNRDDLKNLVMDYFPGKITCAKLVEAVTDYLEGEMGPLKWLKFQMHLGMCIGCRNYLKQMKQTIRTLGELPTAPIPPEVRDELLERFRTWKSGSKNGSGF